MSASTTNAEIPRCPAVRVGLGEHGVEARDAGVRDEALPPVEHVLVSLAPRGRAHRGRVGARPASVSAYARATRRRRASAGSAPSAPRARELQPERAELLDGEDQPARRADLRDLLDRDQREQRPGAGPAPLLVEEEAEDPVLAEELDDVPRELVPLVDLGRRGAIRSRASERTSSRSSRCSSVSTSQATRPRGRGRVAHRRHDGSATACREDAYQSSIPLSSRRPDRSKSTGVESTVILENGRSTWTRAPLARARDRGRPDRRRRRHARDRAREPGDRRPRRALRPPRLHRLARPLPDLGGGASGRSGSRARRRARRSRACARRRRARRRAAGCAARAGASRWAEPPTKEALDAVTGDVPAALISQGLPFALAQLGRARAARRRPLDVPGGVVERDAAASRRASSGRSRRGASGSATATRDDEYLEAMREGPRSRPPAGVTAIHDKDGWLPAMPRLWQRLERDGAALRVWQSLPHDSLDRLAELAIEAGLGDDGLRLGYLKVFMDGTLGSRTARMLDGSGVEITTREELADIVRRAARAGWPVAVHAIGDLRTGTRSTRSRRRGRCGAAPAPPPDRARAVPGAGRRRAVRGARRRRVGAVLPCAVRPRPRRPLLGRPARRRLRIPLAVESGAASRTARTRRSRSSTRGPGSRRRAPRLAPGQALTVEQALEAICVAPAWLTGDERRRGKLLPGYLADLVVLDRDPLAIPPEELPEVQVVATMVGGRWTHNPPPW